MNLLRTEARSRNISPPTVPPDPSRLVDSIPGWESSAHRQARLGSCLVGVLNGEGIGPEIMAATLEVVRAAAQLCRLNIEFRHGGVIGLAAEQDTGQGLTPAVINFCETIFAEGGAVLCGPGGGRFVYDLRKHFQLFCKLVPIKPMPALTESRLVAEARRDVDILLVRENVGGIYFSEGNRIVTSAGHRQARLSFQYSEREIRPIVEAAIRLAERRRRYLALVVKPSGVPAISELWIEIFQEMVAGHDLQVSILEADNACYQLLAASQNFDVVVAPNLFGDILGDEAALLLGSRGLSFSGNFGPADIAVYQTGHGAARDLAGKGIANPIGQILSAAMMLRESFAELATAAIIEKAVAETLAAGFRTADMVSGKSRVVGTRDMGQRIARWISEHGRPPGSPIPFKENGAAGSFAALKYQSSAKKLFAPVAFVDGCPVAGNGHAPVERRNPSNWAETLAWIPLGTEREVDRASQTAARMQRDWHGVSAADRGLFLNTWADLLVGRAKELAGLLALEIGKPLSDATEEIQRAVAMIRTSTRLFGTNQDRSADSSGQVHVRYRPLGVVGIITPWNNPVALPAGKIAAALVLGNGVVWKPAIEAPRTALAVMESLAQAGFPAGLVNMVFGQAETAGLLIDHSLIAAVALTGSIRTGRSAAVRCAQLCKPFQGELGGNNAAIVLRDCDVTKAARGMALAAFSFAGQRCTAIRRFIVERDILGAFERNLIAAVEFLQVGEVGDPRTEVGPLISRPHRDAVMATIHQALAQGGRLLCGGEVPVGLENGCWLTPAVLSNLPPEAALAQVETFGPVAVILPVDDLAEAIEVANGVEQGLVAALHGGDDSQRRLFADAIQAGIVKLSPNPLAIHAEAPFGGWKASGYGPPEHGEWDRQFFTRPQAVYGCNDSP